MNSKWRISSLVISVLALALLCGNYFYLRHIKAQENTCSFSTKISVYKRVLGDDAGPYFSSAKDGPFEVVNNKGQALLLNQDGSSTYTYTTSGLIFDPKGRFAYKKGEQSGIVLTGFDESKYQIEGVFCNELPGSTGGCPSFEEIQKQGRTDMIEGLRVDCGVQLSYGWIVNPLFEEPVETGSLSIRTFVVEGDSPTKGSKACSLGDLASSVGKKIPGTKSYSQSVALTKSTITLSNDQGFSKSVQIDKSSQTKIEFDSIPPGTYSVSTQGVTKELAPSCESTRAVTIQANEHAESALVFWANPGFKCETTTTCSACKSQGKECKVKLTNSYLCCPGKKKTSTPPNPTSIPTVPNDPTTPPPTGGTPTSTPAPKPPTKPSVGTGWCSTEIIGERFENYLKGNGLQISQSDKTKRVAVAACICQRESSAVPTALNDACVRGGTREYSIGLFQLNVWAQPLHCRYTGGDVNTIFTPKNAQVKPLASKCTIADKPQLDVCFNKLTDTDQTSEGDNIQNSFFEMFEKSFGLTNFTPWTTKDDSECNRLIQQL